MDTITTLEQDAVLRQDIAIAAAADTVPYAALCGKTVFVTGATGLIGAALLKTLAAYNESGRASEPVRLVAMVRSRKKAEAVFGPLFDAPYLTVYEGNVDRPLDYAGNVDYIIHGASVTGSKDFVERPVDTIRTALDGTRHLLDFALEKQVSGMVYLSSLEVYGVTEPGRDVIREADYGYMDPTAVRSSYSESKRMAECLCCSYASQYGLPVKIARLTQTFGPGVDYNDGRVFAEFARCVIEGRDIVLHTEGTTVRNYCYLRDAVTALVTILCKGEAGQAYNVANPDTAISIREMANLLAAQYPAQGVHVRVELADAASFGYGPVIQVRLCTEKLQALGWHPEVGLSEAFDRMIRSMQKQRECGNE